MDCNCPDCLKEMKYKRDFYRIMDFGGTADEDLYRAVDKYKCENCKIENVDGKWKIPERLLPTEKQMKTILFINNHLDMDLEAITKKQCIRDIGKYFEKAQKSPLYNKRTGYSEYNSFDSEEGYEEYEGYEGYYDEW